VDHPRCGFAAPSQGGDAGGPAKPDPRRLLGVKCLLAAVLSCGIAAAAAGEAVPLAADPALEKRVLSIAEELRCLVCQNETIAASHADLAVDLRKQIRTQLQDGRNEQQIRDYMVQRYGDFVLYRPPLKPTTVLLWLGPFVLLVIALGALAMTIRQRRRASAAQAAPSDADLQRARRLLDADAAPGLPAGPRTP
jgi:cytochrome c-type biogenesis protein CcmH